MDGPTITGDVPAEDALDGLPEPGDILANKYRIEEMIGRGGMGAVFRAQHELLLETVVLKLVLKGLDADDNARSRFMREARASFQIKSEHVARVLDVDFLDSGKPFMVLEYLQGKDLAQELRQRAAPFEAAQAVEYVLQSLDALAAAHALGIVHRDLKPANLFVVDTPDGRGKIKVLDFGIAKSTRTSEELTVSRIALGTPQYMSPEQLQDTRAVDARADIWSVGVILFELLTRAHPFPGRDALSVYRTIRAGPPPLVTTLAKGVPPELASVIARCLRAAPEERFADVSELAQALAPFVVSSTTSNGIVQRIAEVLESRTTQSSAGVDDVSLVATAPTVLAASSSSATVLMAPVESIAPGAPVAPPRRAGWAIAAGAACIGIAGVAGIALTRSSSPTPTPAAPIASTREVETATPIVDAPPRPEPTASTSIVAPDAHSTTPVRIKRPPPPPPKPRPTAIPAASFDPTAARKL